jgi:thiol-disulfide isomerase/thioredoxin
MLKLQNVVLLIAFLAMLTGCQEEEDTSLKITSLELTLSKSRIVGDNSDFAKVSVSNQDGKSVMEYVSVYFHGEQITGDKIISSTPAISTVYALYNNIKSNEAEIQVVEDKNLKFEKNVLIEQYTGTWCGWCPRAIHQISTLQKSDNKIVHAAIHLSDEMTYSLSSSLGISMEVSGDATQISANVNVKFGYYFTENLMLSVYLLHDSLIANQANYYNTDPSSPYYMAGSTMVNFVHRNVMMKPGTDMFGDLIPPASINIGSIYSRKINFTNFRCDNIKKMIIIAFVTCTSGTKANQVLNCIKTRVGEKMEFEYSGN